MNSTSITSKIAICAAIVGSALAFTPAHAQQNNDTDNNVQTCHHAYLPDQQLATI